MGLAQRKHQDIASKRQAAHKITRTRRCIRIVVVGILFVAIIGGLIYGTWYCCVQIKKMIDANVIVDESSLPEEKMTTPTIKIIDENAMATNGKITDRMSEYIGMAEQDFRDLGYIPVKVVIPSDSIRELDFYLEGYNGRIKMTTDRDTAISVEDADRMIKYLTKIEKISSFEYIDVRIERNGYWK